MEIIFYILLIMLVLVIMSIINEKVQLKKLKQRLKKEWGQIPEEKYTYEKLESLKTFYNNIKDEKLDIDDITWNDLDMDELYMQMNNTRSSMGEEYLYAMLRKPCYSSEELLERDRLMQFFQEKEAERIELQVQLHQVGKSTRISVFEFMNRLEDLEAQSNLPHYFMAFGLLVFIGLIFIIPGLGGVLTAAFAVNNLFRYYSKKSTIENYLIVIASIARMLDSVKGIARLDIPEISKYTELLQQDARMFQSFRKTAGFITSRNSTGSIEEIILDYVRMLFHVDLIMFNRALQYVKKNRKILDRIYMNVGYLDSLIATASFRQMLPYYCRPELVKAKQPCLSVRELYHPMIEAPVPNSIQANRSVLITGSNASGKSTFIKTLAVNAILSQTLYTSVSKSYQSSYFMIYSSMALRDNMLNKESYYIVEIKSLKRILDRVNKEIPILCFIDEVLRGTNTLERIAASSQILTTLAKQNTMVFAATHDIELTSILENYYSNYHFREHIINNEILFDYKLYQGKAISKNAIKLLGLLGYPGNVTQAAERAAAEFLEKGEWSKAK